MDFLKIIGSAVKGVANVALGGLPDTIMDIVDGIAGNDLPPEKRAELQIAIERETTQRQIAANDAARDAEQMVTQRAAELEGTAADLAKLGWVGRLVIGLRGVQRPIWGFGTLYLDVMVFSKQWPVEPDSMTEVAFVLINLLVLGFLFGERAVKNLLPLVTSFLAARSDNKGDK